MDVDVVVIATAAVLLQQYPVKRVHIELEFWCKPVRRLFL